MGKIEGSFITTDDVDSVTEESFLTYSEEEKQQNEINASNAKLVFSPKFIPLYPELLKQGLTITEALIFGFIDFYITNATTRFYFTNKQIGEICSCSERTVTSSIAKLESLSLIHTSRKIRKDGGQIRFVTPSKKVNSNPLLAKSARTSSQNLLRNNNILNNNKSINDKSLIGVSHPKGNEEINLILENFETYTGKIPVDRKPRNVAHNIRQLIGTFIRENGTIFSELRGRELTQDYILQKSWEYMKSKDYMHKLEKIETFKLHMKVYLHDVNKKLVKERRIYEQTTSETGFAEVT